MAQQNRLGTHKTTVTTIDNVLTVVYHSTPIVRVFDDKIVLNTGGWFSATTKTRMNQASSQFGLGYHVTQKQGSWFVDYNGESLQFVDTELTLPKVEQVNG